PPCSSLTNLFKSVFMTMAPDEDPQPNSCRQHAVRQTARSNPARSESCRTRPTFIGSHDPRLYNLGNGICFGERLSEWARFGGYPARFASDKSRQTYIGSDRSFLGPKRASVSSSRFMSA